MYITCKVRALESLKFLIAFCSSVRKQNTHTGPLMELVMPEEMLEHRPLEQTKPTMAKQAANPSP